MVVLYRVHPIGWMFFAFFSLAFAKKKAGTPFTDLPAQVKPCPENIDLVGEKRSNWTITHHLDTFLACHDPKVLEFPLYVPIGEPGKKIVLRAVASTKADHVDLSSLSLPTNNSSFIKTHVELEMVHSKSNDTEHNYSGQLFTAANQLRAYLANMEPTDTETILFAQFGKSAVGIYIGKDAHDPSFAVSILTTFMSLTVGGKVSSTTAIQHCGEGISSGSVVGVISSSGNGVSALRTVQEAVVRWDRGECASDHAESSKLTPIFLWMKQSSSTASSTPAASANSTGHYRVQNSTLPVGDSPNSRNSPRSRPSYSPKLHNWATSACRETRVTDDDHS